MNTKRILTSLILYAAWIVITLFGARWIAGGETTLDELVSTGVGWHFGAAIALLVFAIVIFKWKDMGFSRPHSLIRVLWLPSIYLVLMAAGLIYLGFPSTSVIVFVVINTLMVGASEELMFRGVLFRAFNQSLAIWPAIIVTSILFGAVHVLNVFITGELNHAVLQSIAAAMSGFVFTAIVIRTSSIWPAIIYHFIWDCLLFMVSTRAATTAIEATTKEPGILGLLAPVLLVLPNFIFALYLLRHAGKPNKTHNL